MKAIAAVLIALVTFSCATGERPAVHRLDYHRLPGAKTNGYSMILDGKIYSNREDFLAAVAKLPPRSRLIWHSGCIVFDEIAVDPAPRLSIQDFKTLCGRHRIRFDYRCGLLNPLITKTFRISHPLFPERTDARHWLESQGVTFPGTASARWNVRKQSLVVRNTQENLDTIALIIDHAKPK